jgi:hypothetical protein
MVPAIAQVSIAGTVQDQNRQPLPYATVVLLHSKDSAMVAGTITDIDGLFSLIADAGIYRIQISSIGYQTLLSSVEISSGLTEFHFEPFS